MSEAVIRRVRSARVMALALGLAAAFATGCDTGEGRPQTVEVTGVTLDRGAVAIVVGTNPVQLVATVAPSDATDASVTWTSSNAGVATVSATGLVTAVGAGTATITATTTSGALTAVCTVTVTAPNVATTGVTLDKHALSLTAGGATSALVATVAPANATNAAVTYTSSNTSVATVSATGVVTPIGAGTATITVTTASGSHTDTCAVTVAAAVVPVASVSLNSPTLSLMVGGATSSLTATVLPASATNKMVTWSSSNGTVATVSATGVVSPVAAGMATITVTTVDGSHTATCVVTVAPPIAVSGVMLDMTTLNLLVSGLPTTLVATVTPANAANQAVTWSSSNTAVASVSTSGVVTPVAVGTATITVTTVDGNHTATCSVTVATPTNPVTGVALDAHTLHLTFGGAASSLTATVSPANADNPAVTWSTSDGSVATVSATGAVTATGSGTATITVTTMDGSFTDTCAVTVDPDAVTGAAATTPLTGQAIVSWAAALDPNVTGVEVSTTSANGAATLFPTTVVPVGTSSLVLYGLSYPESYTVTLRALGAASTASSDVALPVTTVQVTYLLRNSYTEGAAFVLDETNGSGGVETHDVVIAKVSEGIPTNYRFVFFPGLADPTDTTLVSMVLERYDGASWTSSSRYLRIVPASTHANNGQWYGWANPNPDDHFAYCDLDDATPTFAEQATFRMSAGTTTGSVVFEWYPETTRRLLHTYYHAQAQDMATVGARFDADSTWFLEPTTYRTP